MKFKKMSKILSALLAVVMVIMAMPMSAFAAVASDLPDNMADSHILRALEYTGYNVQAQKNDGTLYQSNSYGSRTPSNILSDISYGTSTSGKENIADSSTVSGRAPDIATFESKGLCCASFVTYFICNYLPHIEGVDTSLISDAVAATGWNFQACVTWQKALNGLVDEGKIEKIGTSASNVDRSKLTPGDLIIFGTAENSHTHIAVYSGTYKGVDYIIHVGNDRGPEISRVDWMGQAGDKSSYPNAYYHLPVEYWEDDGSIEVYKKDTDGKALAGAVFIATETTTGQQYRIGPTDSTGYAKSEMPIPYGEYKIVESVFPTNYRAYGTTSWTKTLNKDTPNATITINAVNEIIPGNCKIVKTSEDGVVDGISFTLSGNGVNKTVTTANGGEVTISDLKPGTYTVTEEKIDYYEPQEVRTVTIVSGQTATVTFNNTLKRSELKVVKTSEDNMVEGVQFKLSGTSLSGHTVEQFAVTDINGVAVFEDVLITGHTAYTLEEVNVEEKYIVPDTQTAVIEWQKVTEKSFYNELKRGSVKVTKSSEDGFVEGVTFRLKGTSLSGATINLTAKTDHTGVAMFNDVLIGTGYVLTEENVAMRYVLPEAQNVDVKWNEVTGVTVKNILKKWRADVFKVDADIYFGDDDYEEAVPMTLAVDSDMLVTEYGWPYGETQGDATLEGAVYGVFKDGVLLDTYTTDKNGYFLTDYYPCDGSYYYLQEISPSEGYLLDPYEYYVDAYPGNYTVELNTEYIDVYEDIIKGTIALVKHTDDGKTQIETPEVGAEFEVYLKSAGSFENGKDEEKAILVIDETGVAEIEPPYGVYVVKQIKGWEGKELLPAFEVSIDTDEKIYRFIINNAVFESDIQIVKKDAETGKVIPAAGIGFKVLNTDTGEFVVQRINYPTPVDIEVYYTDETGMLMLPHSLPYGNYQIIEETISATGEYVLDTTPVDFKVDGTSGLVIVEKLNYAQKGTITVTKQGEIFSSVTEQDGMYQPVYEIKGLAGAVYEITAAEDIVTLDGTTRYTKGEVVDTITTAADGAAVSCELYLGKYQISEITAPFGMVLNGEKVDVELVYAGQEIAVTSTSASFVNERQKVEIDLAKNLEIDELFGIGNNGEISKVQFGLYATEDMTAEDGKVIPEDGLVESAYCDENGKIAFTTDLPVGASMYIKEIATDAHYILSDTSYPVVFEYAGQDTETVKISVNDGAAIENKIIRGNIVGKKLDEDGFAICGALFGLFRENGTEFTADTALMTCESNEIGVFLFENVPFGRYVVREIKAAPAFVLNENSYAVTVSEDGETVEIVIENRFIVGSVQITKVDKDYPENKLTGSVFEIYVDVDGNGEFNAEIDKLVGEMTEVETGVYRMDNLRYNGYFLYEKTAPEFFNKDDGYYYFEITADGETVIVENEAGIGFVNTAKVGSLKIVKTSSDGVVEGFSFRVTGTNGYDEVFTTNANGEIIIENLRIDGEYVVSEVSDEKNADYILPEDKTAAVIEGSVTIVEMHNERKPEPEPEVPDSPQTGDNSNLPLWFGLMGLSGASLIGITLYSRKRRREEM